MASEDKERLVGIMKTFILLFIFSFNTFACDWSTIQRDGDRFIYSSQCHLSVGKLVKTEKLREEQVQSLIKTIEFKDLALKQADLRANTWEKEAYKQHEFLQKSQKDVKLERIAYFGLGVASVLLGAWAINKVK
jgi:hypothetical protein